jgi:hypothetical protein
MDHLSMKQLFGLGVFLQIATIVIGSTLAIGLSRGLPEESHIWMIVILSAFPWVVMLANGLLTTAPADPPPISPRKDYQLVQVYRHDVPTFEGIDVEDLEYFIRTICSTRDWTQRTWRGKIMPSGIRCDTRMHRKMCDILERAGFFVGRKPRSSGQLVAREPETILATLGLIRTRSF